MVYVELIEQVLLHYKLKRYNLAMDNSYKAAPYVDSEFVSGVLGIEFICQYILYALAGLRL